jgi:hypothetical protein
MRTGVYEAVQLLRIGLAVAQQVLAAEEFFPVIVDDCCAACHLATQPDLLAEAMQRLLLGLILHIASGYLNNRK